MAEYKRPKHQWSPNVDYLVEFLFDEPYVKEGQDGKQYFHYTINVDGKEHTMFASPDLKLRMDALGSHKGETLRVKKEMSNDGSKFLTWAVTKVGDDNTNYATVKNGEAQMPNTGDPTTAYVTEDEKWDKINRDKQLSIIAGQSMNLAVKTVLELKVDAKNFDLEVLKYRDKYYDMMANFNPAETTTTKSSESEEDDLPF